MHGDARGGRIRARASFEAPARFVNAAERFTLVAPGNNYLVIATYPFLGALAALEKQAGGQGVQVPGVSLGLLDRKTHKSVHLAFPKVSYQVFDSSAARALALATSGQARPA